MNKKTILMIDDDESILKLYVFYLEKIGYNVVAKSNAVSAKDWLSSNVPDLILMDIMLPDVPGIEFCRRINSQEKFKNVPIIHMTACMHDDISREDSMLAGAKDLIIKPYEPKDIKAIIEKFL